MATKTFQVKNFVQSLDFLGSFSLVSVTVRSAIIHSKPKVLITCQFNDKIFGYHFLVHEGCVIMMFYAQQELKSGNRKFHH